MNIEQTKEPQASACATAVAVGISADRPADMERRPLRPTDRCPRTRCSAEAAKRQATESVARSGLAVWQTPRTIERSGNQRHDRQGVFCFGSRQPRGFTETLPDGRVSEVDSCNVRLFVPQSATCDLPLGRAPLWVAAKPLPRGNPRIPSTEYGLMNTSQTERTSPGFRVAAGLCGCGRRRGRRSRWGGRRRR